MVRLGMLRRKQLTDGRTVHRMPFRKALKRDVWEPGARAMEIGEEWRSVQRGERMKPRGESDS
jgi:hypothetical protein